MAIRVHLPKIEGFAKYINVSKPTLYEWEEKHADFSYALDKIRFEQKERCMDNGLSGHYNPTIARLILSTNHGMVEKKEIKQQIQVKQITGMNVRKG